MRKYIFQIFWVIMGVLILALAFTFRDGREAMVAEVESRVAAVSFPKAVKIKTLHVIPGQDVKKGDPLVALERHEIELDLIKAKNEIEAIDNSIESEVLSHQFELEKLSSSYSIEKDQLNFELQKLLAQKEQETRQATQLKSLLQVSGDSTLSPIDIKISEIKSQLNLLRQAYNLKRARQQQQHEQAIKEWELKKATAQLSVAELETESGQLIQHANFDGTVGSVFVEQDEIVESYSKLLSLYEKQPTLIKAYTSEEETQTLHVGQAVMVISTNRQYEVGGTIEALGSRVTSYPDKINPNPNVKSYGREVFIRIDPTNQFLNGEKVYVYPLTP